MNEKMKPPREKKVLSREKQEHLAEINSHFRDFYGKKGQGLLNFFKFLSYNYKNKDKQIGHIIKKYKYVNTNNVDIALVKILKMCQELNIKTIKDYNRLKNSLNKDLKECN
jgi:hypothetical protein